MHLACFDAVRAAAAAHTFQTSEAGKPSAVSIANDKVTSMIGNFTGIIVNTPSGSPATTVVIATSMANPSIRNVYTGPLPSPIHTDKCIYQYQVSVDSNVEPIVKSSGGFLGNIPGFSAPIPVKVTASAWCENPSGLTM